MDDETYKIYSDIAEQCCNLMIELINKSQLKYDARLNAPRSILFMLGKLGTSEIHEQNETRT